MFRPMGRRGIFNDVSNMHSDGVKAGYPSISRREVIIEGLENLSVAPALTI